MATVRDAPGRGRPRAFDPDEVLQRVVELFWTQGYEATSMSDIVEVTGLNKSSLYNTFGSKDALFGQALQHYLEMRTTMLAEVLEQGDAGLDDVHRLFDLMELEVSGADAQRGCLAVNTSTELGARQAEVTEHSLDYRNHVRRALRAAFDRAEAADEIATGTAERYTEVLMTFMFGLSVLARAGATPAEIAVQLRSVRAVVDGWRTA